MNDETILPASAIPQSIACSTFRLFGVEVRCHVLDDGTRVIEQESMHALLEAMAIGTINPEDNMDAEAFARWRAASVERHVAGAEQ